MPIQNGNENGNENGNREVSVPTHALLIGIDAYPDAAVLGGCVNDVDAMEAFLLARLKLPARAITKLVAPTPGAERPYRAAGSAAEKTPDLATIRSALEALASERVLPGDRVLIHYSGHGAQVRQTGTPFYREALVPVDYLPSGVLYDQELNQLIQAISARTENLTLLLDCCHAAGTTRGTGDLPPIKERFLQIEGGVNPLDRGPGAPRFDPRRGVQTLLSTGDPSYVLGAACASTEQARELVLPAGAGVRQGAFTWAFLDALGGLADADLLELRWSTLWSDVLRRVTALRLSQRPRLIGRPERRIFGAASADRDAGYLVTCAITNCVYSYAIAGGTLTGLSEGALVAVYGPEPERFPPIDSTADHSARLGVLEVTRAEPTTSVARSASFAFDLRTPARGRLIKPGPADALRVAPDPWDDDLARTFEGRGGRSRAVLPESESVELRVGLGSDRSFELRDERFGPPGPEPAIARIPDHDHIALDRALDHYARYNLTLRLARRCRDLPRALEVTLLDCSDEAALQTVTPDNPALSPFPPDTHGRPAVRARVGQSFCVKLWNRSTSRLEVALLVCKTDGRVLILSTNVTLGPDSFTILWNHGGAVRVPFPCQLPDERATGVDRLIAVGTTGAMIPLEPLEVRETFAEVIGKESPRHFAPVAAAPPQLWTATLVTLAIER